MQKIPKQLIILGLVLLLYFWPWQLFSGDSPESWLLSVITMQIAFVTACNKIVRESWVTAIIIIETFCMSVNILMLLFMATISPYQQNIMATALIIELLIITISLQGVAIGKPNSCRLPISGDRLWAARSGAMRFSNCAEDAQ